MRAVDDKEGTLEDVVNDAFSQRLSTLINIYMYGQEEPDFDALTRELDLIFPGTSQDVVQKLRGATGDEEIRAVMMKAFHMLYENRKKEYGPELWHEAVRYVYLDTLDEHWTEHLTAVDDLRSGINLRGYAQLDPLTEYKNEAFKMFESLLSNINFEVVRRVAQMHIDVRAKEPVEKEQRMIYSSGTDAEIFSKMQEKGEQPKESAPQQRVAGAPAQKKLGRNDPCWCGSGKKYKKCHYPD